MIWKIGYRYDTGTEPQIKCLCILGSLSISLSLSLSLSQAFLTSGQQLKNIPKNEFLEDNKKFNNWKPCPKLWL